MKAWLAFLVKWVAVSQTDPCLTEPVISVFLQKPFSTYLIDCHVFEMFNNIEKARIKMFKSTKEDKKLYTPL